MKNKYGIIFILITILLVLTSCSGVSQEPIEASTPGIWNHYFVFPLSWLIIFVAEHINGSYGLAIIIVTIIIRLCLLPLMVKQLQSSKAMQKLKPEMEKLQSRKDLKDDPQKFQQEMMMLYQKHGVNPFAGCLPIFIQMPILLAFYHAIIRTKEIALHQFLWFDLGSSDPFFILPVVAAITTFLSSKISFSSAAGANPQMNIVLYIMPIMILLTALAVPSALVVYWIIGNLFSMVQSYFLLVRNKES